MRFLPVLLLASALSAGELRTDIEFARPGGESLTLDAWVPEGPGPYPTVIIVHGGGFVAGTKTSYVKPLFGPLTDAGFAWFSINYRLAPRHPFPAAIEDTEAAVRWVRENARTFKVNPNRVALLGESAGGHIVSYIAATTARKLGLRAVVSFYGPHDLLARARSQGKVTDNVAQFLALPGGDLTPEAEKRLAAASPITHARRGMPPMLLIHGTEDRAVAHSQSVAFQARLRELGVECELLTLEGAGHGVEGWEKRPADAAAYKAKMTAWLRARLAK
ncbi:MAG: alpha/beta hydrolase fold domain-containing protein [Bryobacteraceae bacterium]|nr:alpha/beta hydrolase fold domain-containing protein [Bryobacteraceae bacterium]